MPKKYDMTIGGGRTARSGQCNFWRRRAGLLTALARRVRRFEILDYRRLLNNALRGPEELTVSVEQ
jgi:hypothetical protein